MADMYKKIEELLAQKGISGAKMCTDLGMSRSFMTELRKGRAKSITLATAEAIADYFEVPIDHLLGAPLAAAARKITDKELKVALFGGDEEITEEMYLEVLRFAEYVKRRGKDRPAPK